MHYRVLNWRSEGITGGEFRFESIDAVYREVNYPRGWESLERMHAAIRKWAGSARPGDVFIVTQNAAIIAAGGSPAAMGCDPVAEDVCPDCGQEGLDYGPLCMVEGLDVEQDLECPGCEGRWTDRFSRVGRRPFVPEPPAES